MPLLIDVVGTLFDRGLPDGRALVGVSLLEGIEVSPHRCILTVLRNKVPLIDHLGLETLLMLVHGSDELVGLLLVIDHVLDLHLEAVLVLLGITSSCLNHILRAASQVFVEVRLNQFHEFLLLLGHLYVLRGRLFLTKAYRYANIRISLGFYG